MTQHATIMLRSSHSPPLFSIIWEDEILFIPLHPCTVVLSGFLQSTKSLHESCLEYSIFSPCTGFAEHSRPLRYSWYYPHFTTNSFTGRTIWWSAAQMRICLPSSTCSVCNSAFPCQVLSHQRSSWARGREDAAHLPEQRQAQMPLRDLCS